MIWQSWGDLLTTVRTGETAVHRVFKTGSFEYFEQHPEEAAIFDEAMGSFTAMTAIAVAAAYDFSAMRKVVDVGGGQGALLAGILRANPKLHGVVFDLPRLAVQHHHAHVAACMVEHGRVEPVLGIAYDGLGYGPDGSLWGGEMLVADLVAARRVAHLRPVRMPGGTAAIREPWRMGAVWSSLANGNDAAVQRATTGGTDATTARAVLDLAAQPSSPITTSAGRLFDAVAALLGGRQRVTYEAQAAIELEALARSIPRHQAPRYEGCATVAALADDARVLDPSDLIAALLADLDAGVGRAVIAAGFHQAFGRATAILAAELAAEHHLDTIAMTGGVFQNALLTEIVREQLGETGLDVLVHATIPPNDGGISIGQAAIAAFS